MIRIAICDNDICLCSEIESVILAYGKKIAQIYEIEVFYSGDELYKYLENNDYFDIIYLDIEMGLIDGIEVGQKIRKKLKNDMIQIIYMSSYTKYSMELFKNRPTDFLVKPLEIKYVEKSLAKSTELTNTLSQIFSYKIGRVLIRRPVKEILYFRSKYREVEIVYIGGQDVFYSSLDSVYDELKPYDFFNTHRSFIVNYNHIIKIHYDKLVLTNNETIPISFRKRKEFRNLIESKSIGEFYE